MFVRKFPSLYEKYILNPDNLDTLCNRWKRDLQFCRDVMGDEFLMQHSSIQTAYPIAREEYIKKNIPKEEWHLYDKQNRYPLRVISS